MKTIQITIDEDLLEKVDRLIQAQKVARSQFIREALVSALHRLSLEEKERRQAEGYRQHPVAPGEFDAWEKEQVWG